MSFPALLILALALSLDNLAVALSLGLGLGRPKPAQILRLAGAFGFFQVLMPILGWSIGLKIRPLLESLANPLACGLLGLVGLKMLFEAARPQNSEQSRPGRDPTKGPRLLMLALSTSLDALAVGLSFSVLGQAIWFPACVFGLVCFVLTALGLRLGGLAGRVLALGRFAEVLGGVAIIGIGLKTFLGL